MSAASGATRPAQELGEHNDLYDQLSRLQAYEVLATTRRRTVALGRAQQNARGTEHLIVTALMLATTAVAVFDLYLLGTGLAH
ncbi:MAG TPA: hypothetical protein VME20_08790 [Acidimicrobiales bacterium]|nr:hypothetical protein [Acidimicrobiales bacterium]